MLYSIYRGNVKTYQNGQKQIIYLVTTLEQLISNKLQCVYTDGHGIMELTGFYDDIQSLDKLDRNAIDSEKWGYPTFTDDQDLKRRKQAEFLVQEQVPWQLVYGIGVYNTVIEEQVNAIISKYSMHKPLIKVKKSYYFTP